MKYIELGSSGMRVPTFAVGCMRINGVPLKRAEELVKTALENGANFFDHADIYGGGECESIFAEAIGMTPSVREKIFIQSKTGIVKNVRFDFSKKHILESVDGSLRRLKTDYLDVLILHRPDALMERDDIAEAFDILRANGKVRHFGVSNQNPWQTELISSWIDHPIVCNQIQLSPVHMPSIQSGINVNMLNESAVDRGAGIIEYCRLKNITIQPWSPFQYGFFEGTYIDNPAFSGLNKVLARIAEEHDATKGAVVMAWLLRHPAHFQPVIGTMNKAHFLECLSASDIELTRDEWYEIYMANGNILP